MNKSIRFGAVVSLLLILALLVNFTVVQTMREDEYAQDARNSRIVMDLKKINRGNITAGDLTLAESFRNEDTGYYQRAYPNMPWSFAPVVGYASDQFGTAQIESGFNGDLTGDSGSSSRFMRTGLEDAKKGDNVQLTLDPNLQAFAFDQLAKPGYEGAVVAMRPSSGEVLAMASAPSYDPNAIVNPASAGDAWGNVNNDPGKPLLNHGTQDQLPPGSIFKIITTAAGLRNGYTPDSPLTGDAQIMLPGTDVPLTNYGGQACAGGGQVPLRTAFALSCNTAFVQMGLDMGPDALRDAAARFGVGQNYDLGLPNAAGSLGDLPGAAELGQSAIGQRDVTMTALQAAVMAASVANKGQRMAPFVVKQVRDEDGKVLRETKPKSLGEAVTEEEAATITDLMFGSERATWGYDGNGFASKTGTAEHAEGAAPHVWYVAFDPQKDVAVAVVVKNGGNLGEGATGGQVSGPIGRAVLRAAPAPVEGDK
ncbi:penicillin-binding transpeptidase domain-containing protein [Corynebacterium lujinxingii]|uniref:Penicillin-binding protein 2 n=1 Tax=Corynebacterium lujinxingii TaxID=2763010 RepID=A0A7H0JYZ5_9CORY|nr:penicillin-binding transpeptidase domain-containing protein [Corynebacterium lujinxingii]MBC3179242.1 penicillin-binding protein 2 [Corynebacterium lujinxingii]NNO10118.1 penicillin-binding protein 2 [Corynebacterium lujinxingii]QNP90261.1 penicillin-binding protein 2 [Corynebacterium lujinxingii]